jgi:hypothetical protein
MRRPPIILPVAEYQPDMPDYMGSHSPNVMNVYARTPRSYGPVNSPSAFSGALSTRCQGAYFGIDSSGNVDGFAGDSKDLWQLTAATSPTWAKVSKSAGAYGISGADQWKFTIFGTRVIATNIADPVQSFILGSSTKFADLIVTANPPKASFCAVVKSFLVLGNTSDATYGAQPQRVWWSRNGNPTSFDDPGSLAGLAAQYQTSYQDLLGDNGVIKGIVGNLGNADGAVFMDHAVWRMIWAGGGVVFDFFPAQGVRGCFASGSLAQLGDRVYGLFEDGFYVFDGATAVPIGANKVDKTFFTDLDSQYVSNISAAIDPVNKLYIILYPGAGHNGVNCNKLLMYNWQLNRWTPSIPISAGAEFIMRALSFGYTLDQLYTILGYTLDTVPYPLDSRVWTGGSLLLGIFDTLHKLNFFTGSPLAATVDSSEIQPSPGQVTRFFNARPIIDGNAMPSVSIGVRNRQVDTPAFGPAVQMTSLGTSPQRILGRYARARLTVPAGASSWTNISGVELEGAPAGARS